MAIEGALARLLRAQKAIAKAAADIAQDEETLDRSLKLLMRVAAKQAAPGSD